MPEFDLAQTEFKRISAAQKLVEYHLSTIKGQPNPTLRLQAYRRAA